MDKEIKQIVQALERMDKRLAKIEDAVAKENLVQINEDEVHGLTTPETPLFDLEDIVGKSVNDLKEGDICDCVLTGEYSIYRNSDGNLMISVEAKLSGYDQDAYLRKYNKIAAATVKYIGSYIIKPLGGRVPKSKENDVEFYKAFDYKKFAGVRAKCKISITNDGYMLIDRFYKA